MSRCNLRRDDWIECLHCLHGWILLRHHGTVRGYWQLRRWGIFSCFGKRLLVLLGWNLHFNGISIELLELLDRQFRCDDWIECMQRLHSWVILRHDGTVRVYWQLRRWDVFSCICNCLFELFGWNLFVGCIINELLKLSWRILFNNNWRDFNMHFNLRSRHLFRGWSIHLL